MRNRRGLLVATNIMLGAGLALSVWATRADAVQQATRARGQYTMVSGEIQGGGDASAIYITDSVNQEMVALRWNNSRKELDGLGFRDLDADLNAQPGR